MTVKPTAKLTLGLMYLAFVVILLGAMLPVASAAQTYTVLHNFNDADGAAPSSGVTLDRAGNMYGTTSSGGNDNVCGCGIVYELTRSGSGWLFHELYQFQGANYGDGANPESVIFGPDGALYGTTRTGGTNLINECDGSCGTVFRLTPPPSSCRSTACSWTETVLHRFQGGADGALPSSGDLVFDRSGSLYGTTGEGGGGTCDGFGCGTVYEMSHTEAGWSEQLLYSFPDGLDSVPSTGLIFDNSGVLYGGTLQTVYSLTDENGNWTKNNLFIFSNGLNDGDEIAGGLIFDQSGNLYGPASVDGPLGGGTVFGLIPSGGGWTFRLLHAFSGDSASQTPGPRAALTMDASGNLYGTTYIAGAYSCGSVFKLTPSNGSWTYTSMHDFTCGDDGGNPVSSVSLDSAGNLYGTASVGGTLNRGTVWEITP